MKEFQLFAMFVVCLVTLNETVMMWRLMGRRNASRGRG